jgi:hypothetical protein
MDVESFEQIAALVTHLSPRERLRLVEHIMGTLEESLPPEESPQPLPSLYGLWADLNVNVSAEDIDEARREMWGNFPREDI